MSKSNLDVGRTDVPKDHDDEAQINDMGNGPIELSTLPEELLLRILKLLSHSDLSNLMLVNKKFNNLASDPALWRQYHIPVKEISELSGLDVLGRVLQLSRFSKLQYLDLHEVRDAVLGKQAFYFFGQDSATIESAISQQFQDILITASTLPLKRLDLSCYNNLAAIPAPDILSKLVLGIEHVELADSGLGPQILSDILEGISDTSVLRNVDFRYCEFDSLPVHLIPKLNCLTNVSLEGSIMTTEQVKALLMEMGRGSKIVKLDLGYDSIEDVETRWDAFESVEPEVVAKALNNVEYLIKDWLSDVHLAAFLQEMGRKTKLKKLEMEGYQNFFHVLKLRSSRTSRRRSKEFAILSSRSCTRQEECLKKCPTWEEWEEACQEELLQVVLVELDQQSRKWTKIIAFIFFQIGTRIFKVTFDSMKFWNFSEKRECLD